MAQLSLNCAKALALGGVSSTREARESFGCLRCGRCENLSVATQALFYSDVVPVSYEAHADLCVDTAAGHAFSANTNFVPLAGVEFEVAAWHYPIVFVGQGDKRGAAAILGYRDHENLYVDAEGKWNCEYVPSYVRRYPFILANVTDQQTFTLCLDPNFDGCNEDDRGERLFLLGGTRSAYLERTLKFVQQYHAELHATDEFSRQMVELDLLEPMQAQIALDSGEKLSLMGFGTVSRERLAALSGDQLKTLSASGALELIYLHLFSLGNFGPMMDRYAARSSADS